MIQRQAMERYLRQTAVEGFRFVHRPQVRQGSDITMRVHAPRCRTSNQVGPNGVEYMLSWHMLSFTLNDRQTMSRWGPPMHRMMNIFPWSMTGGGPQIPADLPPGRYPLSVKIRVGVTETTDPQAHQNAYREVGWPRATFIEWEELLESQIEILPADAQLIEVVDDAVMLEQVRQGLTLKDGMVEMIRRGGQQLSIRGTITLAPPPMDLGWQGWMEVEGRRWPVAKQSFAAGQAGIGLVLYAGDQRLFKDFPANVDRCRIILQGDIAAAEESLDIGNKILGGEIVIEDVPIVRAQP